MEDYPRQRGALFTVIAVEEAHVVVTDADGHRYRARCLPHGDRLPVAPLKPGDVLIVNHVNLVEGRMRVERVATLGERDGARYTLCDHALAATAEPA